MSRRFVLLAVLAALVLLVAGCGGGDGEAEDRFDDALRSIEEGEGLDNVEIETDDEGRSITIESDEGTATIETEGSVPADFPWPIVEGCEVMNVNTLDVDEGRMITVALKVDLVDAERVAAFYEDEFEAAGLEVFTIRTGTENAGVIGVNGEGDDGAGSLSVILNGDDALATLSWASRSD